MLSLSRMAFAAVLNIDTVRQAPSVCMNDNMNYQSIPEGDAGTASVLSLKLHPPSQMRPTATRDVRNEVHSAYHALHEDRSALSSSSKTLRDRYSSFSRGHKFVGEDLASADYRTTSSAHSDTETQTTLKEADDFIVSGLGSRRR